MVVTLWVRLPLLKPPFVLKIGKTMPTYGPNMIQLKSGVMKITCLRPVFCCKNKPNHYREYLFQLLLKVETHVAPMVVTLWARLPLLEHSFVLKVAKTGPS